MLNHKRQPSRAYGQEHNERSDCRGRQSYLADEPAIDLHHRLAIVFFLFCLGPVKTLDDHLKSG